MLESMLETQCGERGGEGERRDVRGDPLLKKRLLEVVRWLLPRLPLVIILQKIERELCLRGEGGSGKAKKIWGSGDREEREGVNT